MCPLAIYKRSRRPLSLFVRGLILILCVISLNSQVSAVFASPSGSPILGAITRTAIPVPSDCVSTDFRPFAVSWYHNSVYVGAICSAESTVTATNTVGNTSKLQAYVLQDLAGSGFLANPVFQFPLNFPRHCATSTLNPLCTSIASANWRPWHPDYAETIPTSFTTYPQPMLTSIAFQKGDLILGMRDRYGNQLGFGMLTPNGKRTVSGIAAGDILRACLKTPGDLSAGWTLENNASCGGVQTGGINNGQGPANGEYYYQDSFSPYHDHVALGSVLQLPGFSELASTVFDPEIVNTGGIRKFDTTTGIKTSSYQIYNPTVAGEFNKANGLGSLVALCQSAPVEIGNRVWFDRNSDGIQGPDEPGIAGVTVHLYASDGTTLLATTTTKADGTYSFPISPYKSYIVKLDYQQDYTKGPLAGLQLTKANQDTVNHVANSKAVLSGPTASKTTLHDPTHAIDLSKMPQISIAPHMPGKNDNDEDIGFKPFAAPQIIAGTVFDDYNQDGIREGREPGINGVVVSAYDSTGTQIATSITGSVSGIVGSYELHMPAGVEDARVQFENIGPHSTQPWLRGFETSNHVGGIPVTFVHHASQGAIVNLGIERPEEYCQNNPNVATNCYITGNQTNTADHVVVRFPYDTSGSTISPTPLATAPQVGTTLGLTYRRSSDSLFASSYIKREAGLKPGGSTGAIYVIQGADNASKTAGSLFVDLNQAFGNNTAGADPHLPANYPLDPNAYDAVGKIGLGGMTLSADEQTLYTINLADKRLYSIALGAAPAIPQVGRITRTDLPTISGCSASDVRPFAVTEHWGDIYVGAVCSAESTLTKALPGGDASKLQAYVLRYMPGSGFAAQPVFTFPLNYSRRCANNAYTLSLPGCKLLFPASWNPWRPTFAMISPNSYPVYPQPMLTGITFDNGDLILGLRDRYGDQAGWNSPPPSGGGNVNGITAGDILRACQRTPGDPESGWTLENNGLCGKVQTAGKDSGRGPGNGKYYYQDSFHPYHDNVGLGGVEQVPGFSTVMASTFDPTNNINTGGARAFNDTDGTTDHGYQVYNSSVPRTFGKTSGLGSVAVLCHSAPIEIGHRVWLDSNKNGIQDADEAGLQGVTVNLYAADGVTLLDSTVTDADGAYYFQIKPYIQYVIKLDNPTDYATSGLLAGAKLTLTGQDLQTFDTDSKAILPQPTSPIGTGNYPQILVSAHTPGQNDEAFDIGLTSIIGNAHVSTTSCLFSLTLVYLYQSYLI